MGWILHIGGVSTGRVFYDRAKPSRYMYVFLLRIYIGRIGFFGQYLLHWLFLLYLRYWQ